MRGPAPSERLLFGTWSETSPSQAHRLWGDPRVTALIGGPFDRPAVEERLAREIALETASRVQYWPLFLRDGAFIGCAGLRPYDLAKRSFELGVHLVPEQQGRGLATEAARAVIDHAFGVLGVRELFAGHHPRNDASRHLLTKLGFRHARDELYPPTGLIHPSYTRSRPRTVYYVAASADGFIARPDGGVDWLEPFPPNEFGAEAFMAGVGGVVLGRTTYQQSLGFGPWPYGARPGLVVSGRPLAGLPAGVRAVDPGQAVAGLTVLRTEVAGETWIVGGAQTARLFLDAGQIDEVELYVIPRLLGAGVPLFAPDAPDTPSAPAAALSLIDARTLALGVVMLRWAVSWAPPRG
jgi:RimJ/RimL family protein N-acetyltransferase/dihydrofolate reductase